MTLFQLNQGKYPYNSYCNIYIYSNYGSHALEKTLSKTTKDPAKE